MLLSHAGAQKLSASLLSGRFGVATCPGEAATLMPTVPSFAVLFTCVSHSLLYSAMSLLSATMSPSPDAMEKSMKPTPFS